MSYTVGATLLDIQNVNLNFGEKKVLRDINLQIKDIEGTSDIKGQVVTLLGRSGVGKTQLFKIIAGLLKPSSGCVHIGYDAVKVAPGMVGMVLQSYPLFEHRTLLDNLNLVSCDKAKIEEYLVEFDIVDHKDKYPKRTAIVQQLLCSDHFILLDEPFSGLDPVATEKLCMNISKVANHDTQNTVIISSHILEPALAISDSVYMLGYEYQDKTKVEGATIMSYYDLAANGLAWSPDLRKRPEFSALVETLRNTFQII
jgi:ABC-type nitrate/sulfonate/bicarbonate transport system ATPase subunit